MMRISKKIVAASVFFLFSFAFSYANESDWDLLNNYTRVETGTSININYWWLILQFDFEPVLLLDGKEFSVTQALSAEIEGLNTTRKYYSNILAPEALWFFGVKEFGIKEMEFYKETLAGKKTRGSLGAISNSRTIKTWFHILALISIGFGTFNFYQASKPNSTFSGYDPNLVGAGAFGLAILCNVFTLFVNNSIEDEYRKIADTLTLYKW